MKKLTVGSAPEAAMVWQSPVRRVKSRPTTISVPEPCRRSHFAEAAMTGPRVLLADDHRLLREAFARVLESDCDVVGAVGDGQAVLPAAQELRPDIVVLDIAMPLLNGLDAARQLKRTMPDVKIIFLTMNED